MPTQEATYLLHSFFLSLAKSRHKNAVMGLWEELACATPIMNSSLYFPFL